ncbi:uncharacterized protein JCM6883_001737 [Sporobolomyces salmoneus]|uniref:uncharacterized protein n=1 Tax=Sporobolomyces salmoneus TaxID=183962 RepID=UPI0031822DE1
MSIRAQASKLPQLLSLLPKDGVGSLVYQNRWKGKGLPVPSPDASTPTAAQDTCFYEVKKVQLKQSEQGKLKAEAFGVLYWKGKRVTPEDQEYEPLRGAKYLWQSANPPLVLRTSAEKPAPTPEVATE